MEDIRDNLDYSAYVIRVRETKRYNWQTRKMEDSEPEIAVYVHSEVKADPNDPKPVSWGLNSKVVKIDGKVSEIPWKSGGMYGPAIDKIIYWLEKARDVALSDMQKKELDLLISYYRTADLKTWDDYNVLWAGNTGLSVDYINGFIETYGDPLGMMARVAVASDATTTL